MTDWVPNSGAHEDQIAPIDAVARNAINVSGTFGRYATTRSPRSTPSRSRPVASRAIWSLSSRNVSSWSSRVCERAMTATASSPRRRVCSA